MSLALALSDDPGEPIDAPSVHRALAVYFGRVLGATAGSTDRADEAAAPPAEGSPSAVVDAMLTAAGARPVTAASAANRAALARQVAGPLRRGGPIAAHMLWSPKKHWVVGADSAVDLAELAALDTLYGVHLAVARLHPPGVAFQLDVEDLEFEFMEGEEPDVVGARERYIGGLRRLLAVLGLDRVFSVALVSEKATSPEELRRWRTRLRENYRALETYWWESEAVGPERSCDLESYRALCRLGWRGPIPPEMRRHYLARLGSPAHGDHRRRVAMVLRNLAGILLHRQEGLGNGRVGPESVKFSFIPPAAGAPQSLLDGRVDLRFVPRRICSRVGSAGPWSTKGHLRAEGEALVPAFLGWHEIAARRVRFATGRLVLRRDGLVAELRVDRRLPADP